MKGGNESQLKVGQQQVKTVEQSQERGKRKQALQKVTPNPQIDYGVNYKQKEVLKEDQVSDQSPKPERLDVEIEEIAKRIKEANALKMVQIKNVPKFHANQTVPTTPENKTLSEDWTSVQGQFGWTELSNTTIPYLTRSGKKYVCLRMAESKIFFVYRQYFSDDIRTCYNVEKLKITKAEADLLNEINFRHCDNFFGRVEFSVNDDIVALDDIQEMYGFLDFCYTRLVEKNTTPHKKCGFIRIASQNCVPYVYHDGGQYVPLFYFEGECKYLEERSKELRGWELAYLKLACKIQGIRKALFDEDSVRVVETELVKKFFPPDTLFEWMWLANGYADTFVRRPLMRIVQVEAEKRKAPPPPRLEKRPTTLRMMPLPMSNANRSRILQIPDFACDGAGSPYFLVHSRVEGKQLSCINMEPYLTTKLMVSLEEVASSFYLLPLESVANAVNAMRLDVFLPNKLQVGCLKRWNKYPTVGFIKLGDFICNIPQIRYILSS